MNKPVPRGLGLSVCLLMVLGGCHQAPELSFGRGGVGLCTLSVNAGALVYGKVASWSSPYVGDMGMKRTPVHIKVEKVIRGPLPTGLRKAKMFGSVDAASGRLSVPGSPAQDAALEQNGQNTEGYFFLWKDDLSVVEGSGYLWLEPDGLYHSGSTADGLVDGVTAQTILDADRADSGKATCSPPPASGLPSGPIPPDGGTETGDAGFRSPPGDGGT